MILRRGVVAPFALLVALVTTTLVFAGGIAEAPLKFVGGDDVLLLGPEEGLPGQSAVPSDLALALAEVPYVDIVSPEVYVPIVLDGRSAFVRGADADALLALEGATLLEGRMPRGPREALAGWTFARQHDLEPGSELFLPSAFQRLGAPVTIVGIVDDDGPLRDELVVDLATGRMLTNLGTGEVHLVRIRASDVVNATRLLHSYLPVFTYSDVRLSSQDVVTGEGLELRANLTNWGRIEGTKTVEVRVDGLPAASMPFTVPPRATIPIAVPFAMDRAGPHNVTVNPTLNVTVREATLQVSAPDVVSRGVPFTVRVSDKAGAPVAGVRVEAGQAAAVTDDAGLASITVTTSAREARVYAIREAVEGVALVRITEEPPSGPARFEVQTFGVEEAVAGNTTPLHLQLSIRNRGAEDGNVRVAVKVDGSVVAERQILVFGGSEHRDRIALGALPAGLHLIELEGVPARTEYRVYAGPDPAVEAYLSRMREEPGAGGVPPPVGDRDYVTGVIGNVRAAVTLLSLLGVALTTLGLVFVLVRHLADAQPRIGILRAMGASNARVTSIVERETAARMAIAALVGMAAGVLVARAMAAAAIVRAFGHSVDASHPLWVMLLVYALSIGIAVVTARTILAYHLRTPVDQQLRGSTLRPLPVEPIPLAEALRGGR